jgi:hypothetical protein
MENPKRFLINLALMIAVSVVGALITTGVMSAAQGGSSSLLT